MILQNFLPLICHQWASCVVFFLSDDGPESSFLGTKKPHNKLILCGLVLFRLLLAGISPTRQVELEGIEPSSKRGTNALSTCVVSDWLSGTDRPGLPICSLVLKFSRRRQNSVGAISDISAPPGRLVSEKGQPGDVSSLQLLRG